MADALVIVSKSAAPAEDAPTPGLSEEQRAMLKAAYADIDTNKSGTIEVAEFKSVPGNKQLKGHYLKQHHYTAAPTEYILNMSFGS